MMTAIKSIISNGMYYIFALIFLSVIFLACLMTHKITDASWQKKWDEQQQQISAANAKAESEIRSKEQEYQNAINKISDDGERKLAAARQDAQLANAAVERSSAAIERLRQQVNSAIATGSSTEDSRSPATGKTAAQAVNLLADVLKKSVERNRQLAAFADDAWERGRTCEVSFDSIVAAQTGAVNGEGPITTIAR